MEQHPYLIALLHKNINMMRQNKNIFKQKKYREFINWLISINPIINRSNHQNIFTII
jgi:hypothetical protein